MSGQTVEQREAQAIGRVRAAVKAARQDGWDQAFTMLEGAILAGEDPIRVISDVMLRIREEEEPA